MNQSKRLHQCATRPPPRTPPRKTPTGSTTLSPFPLKLQVISGTPKEISPFVTTPAATETTNSGTRQGSVKVLEKSDRLIIRLKNLPRRTDGASPNEVVKSLAVIKTDETQPTPCPNDHSLSRNPTTATTTRRKTLESEPEPRIESEPEPKLESDLEPEIESEVERELETEDSRGQGGTRGRAAERWIMDAVAIPIPKWLQLNKCR